MTEVTFTFNDLGLSENVSQAVSEMGYITPTQIQAEAIPLILRHHDVVGIAQTGTGKTASFTLPLICRLEKGRARARMPRCVILEPTRELAAQVAESFLKYGKYSKLDMALLIGGVSMAEQEQKLMRGVDILIATPGRLMDHYEKGRLLLNKTEILVIDEADRMLDMGFIPDIEKICAWIPFTRQNLLFSATMPDEIRAFVSQIAPVASQVSVAPPSSTSLNITQIFVGAPKEYSAKRARLRDILAEEKEIQNAIFFCNRKKDVAILAKSLQKHGFNAAGLHGDMAQSERLDVLEKFKSGEIQFLTASDVAARGLDIPSVSHVFNFDIPTHAEDYVHRIGRTGRAGRLGKSFTFVTKADQKYLDAIKTNSELEIIWHHKFDEKAWHSPVAQKKNQEKKDIDQSNSAPQKSGCEHHSKHEKPSRYKRHDSQRDIGEMNKDKSVIIGFGEHVPAFFNIAI